MKVLSALAFTLLVTSTVRSQPTKFMWIPDGNGQLHLVDLYENGPEQLINPEKDVSLRLYTKNNPELYERIQIEHNSIPTTFNKTAKTRFVIHGWKSSAKNMDQFRKAYLENTDNEYNIILVDWSGPADSFYFIAKNSCKQVGLYVGQVIKYLVSHGTDMNNIQIAGHSLGGHAAGVAGHVLNGKLTMITGMDPALPLFGDEEIPDRLDASDAQFVQVIHTCAGLLGWEPPLGHADFYPNGGKRIQPGCIPDLGGACSHSRSHDFFIESITSNVGFRGVVCDSWQHYQEDKCNGNPSAFMGEFVSHEARGSFYLRTASAPPYALG